MPDIICNDKPCTDGSKSSVYLKCYADPKVSFKSPNYGLLSLQYIVNHDNTFNIENERTRNTDLFAAYRHDKTKVRFVDLDTFYGFVH